MVAYWDNDNQQLRVRLAARFLHQRKFQQLSEWLGCYTYIEPADRTLYYPLTKVIQILTAADAYHMYLWLSCIESCLNLYDQQLLCQLILEY